MIDTSDKYFLMIEPNLDGPISDEPINDELTDKVRFIYNRTVEWHAYKGSHRIEVKRTFDGVRYHSFTVHSDNHDHVLQNGTITNSLCIFYVQYYRPFIPPAEIEKINRFYNEIKSAPNKLWKQGGQLSERKKTTIHETIEPTEKEKQEEHERWEKEWAEQRRIEEEYESRVYSQKEAKDPRSSFFKEVMKSSGFPLRYK